MNITILGTGYVGLVTGVCLSDFGHRVTCVDQRQATIDSLRAGRTPFFEPGLDAMIARNQREGRLQFTTEAAAAITAADALFIAVGTPTRDGGREADLDQVFAAARQACQHLPDGKCLIVKSTVPVGSNQALDALVQQLRPGSGIAVASNPEFLREGSAIEDFMRPDRVVVGVQSPAAEALLRRIYRPLSLRSVPLVVTDWQTAELIKYAANAFLALKISYINEIADLCERVGANVQQVAHGIGLDGRIGDKFLHPGPGFGGSCFPKDIRALAAMGQNAGAAQRLVETVIDVNEARQRAMVTKIITACGGSVAGKRLAVFGLAFKPNTDDMREAPSLQILPALHRASATLVTHDPEAMTNARSLLPFIETVDDPYLAAANADAAIILTEWNVYRGMDLRRLASLMTQPLLIDLRNVWALDEIADSPFAGQYVSIGRPNV